MVKDHIPDWAGSRRGPQCDTGMERIEAASRSGGFLTREQATEVLARLASARVLLDEARMNLDGLAPRLVEQIRDWLKEG